MIIKIETESVVSDLEAKEIFFALDHAGFFVESVSMNDGEGFFFSPFIDQPED